MGDLIDREKVIEAVKRYGKEAISAGRKILDPVDDIAAISRMIAAMPAVDAVPVVHGRWIPRKGKWFVYFQCSVCGEKISYPSADGKALTNYCPNCGAKMDGEEEPNGK